MFKLNRGSIKSSLRDGLSTPYRLSKEECLTHILIHIGDLHFVPPALNLSILDAVWHFDNGAISTIDDVQIEHGGQVDGTILKCSYSLSFVVHS